MVAADAEFVRSGIDPSRATGLSLWDALIVQAAALAHCDRILSEDLQDGAIIEGVRVENPFRVVTPQDQPGRQAPADRRWSTSSKISARSP